MKKLEKLLKRFLLLIIKILFPARKGNNSPADWKSFERVLVFRLDNRLGNAILILPLVQAIKKSVPSVQTDVLMSAAFCQVYDQHPDITEVIPYDQAELLKKPWHFIGLILRLRKKKYDVVLSSTNADTLSVSQALFSRMLKATFTVGFQWKDSEQFYTHTVKGNNTIYYGDAQTDLWRLFDPQAPAMMPRVYFAGGRKIRKKDEVLLWLGATKRKILPAQRVAELIAFFDENNINYRVAAGPADRELHKLYRDVLPLRPEYLQGSLRDTAEFFLQFRMIFIPDTGPMHLAVALEIPTVQLFHQSDSRVYACRSEYTFLIEDEFNAEELKGCMGAYGW